jgi:plastocyanin
MVSIANFAFEPAQLTIAAGQRVTWSSDDGVRFADGLAGQALMLPGQSFAQTFATPSICEYVCAVHPYMTARITVR